MLMELVEVMGKVIQGYGKEREGWRGRKFE
jgi:hypothetical protein